MIKATIGAAFSSLALLCIVFGPLEYLFPARPKQRRFRKEFFVDLVFFFGQYLVWNLVAIALLSVLEQTFYEQFIPLHQRFFHRLHPVAGIILAIVFGDMLIYWFHRACHTFEFLWKFHAVHHSSEHLDFLAAHREHPVDGICTQLCANLPAFILGVNIEPLAALFVFRGMWAIFVHSNVRIPLGPLRWILGAPEFHHWHHARVHKTQHNFANLAPWLDIVFRTHYEPSNTQSYELGLTSPWPKGYWAQLVQPFREFYQLVTSQKHRLLSNSQER